MQWFRFAVFCVGIPLSAILMLGGAAAATAVDFSPTVYAVFGALSLMAGSFSAGLHYGRSKRTGGMGGGLLCGAAISVFWYVLTWAVNGSAGLSPVLLLGLLSGSGGGIWGVNLPAPAPVKGSHRVLHLRQRLHTVAEQYQKKRYYHSRQEAEKSTSEN